jgi:hypothetical protein
MFFEGGGWTVLRWAASLLEALHQTTKRVWPIRSQFQPRTLSGNRKAEKDHGSLFANHEDAAQAMKNAE